MKALVLGSGGREHAIAWKLAQEIGSENVLLHPGNPGTRGAGFADLGDTPPESAALVADQAQSLGVTLIVIGPEAYLAQGHGDRLRERGFLVVGPSAAAARLETSKAFAKEFMSAAKIPTAKFRIANSADTLESIAMRLPTVLKYDGLAAGKGVVIAQKPEDVTDFAARVWNDEFGPGPHRVVVEDLLPGVEVSYLGFCDGHTFVPLATATDYKRVGDGNTGANTGGMGAISPSPYFTEALRARVHRDILEPFFRELAERRLDYRGILYVGLMVGPDGTPRVLEFNTRFGDPETQAILLRLEGGFAQLLEATAKGTLAQAPAPRWSPQTSLYVVGAAAGYPAKARSGDPIEGLDSLSAETPVFFSGVGGAPGALLTGGGRVLGVGALAKDAKAARIQVYSALEKIRWNGLHYRKDIGLT